MIFDFLITPIKQILCEHKYTEFVEQDETGDFINTDEKMCLHCWKISK